ncbi:MAG: type I methionyl aminopeptidase [Clostridiales bacterium]|nr:type I methionyl aminopeptidase [Clostridiales bacterium]
MIKIKSESEILKMRESGSILSRVFCFIKDKINIGMTTRSIDRMIEKFILDNNAVPSFKGYKGFPNASCISINEEVVHGIPGEYVIKNGDIVSVDVGVFFNGFHSDAARSYLIGDLINKEDQKLIDVTKESFFEGIKFAKENNFLFDISNAIQEYTEKNGFSVVRDYVGHGIGSDIHEAPEVPNFKQNRRGVKLCYGMTLAIEPMINIGTHEVLKLDNHWTVMTKDKKKSAHYENTILITNGDPEILTLNLEEE